MKLQNKKVTILCTCILFAWTIVCTLIVCTCLEENKADAVSDFTTYTATATDAGYGISPINIDSGIVAGATRIDGCITYGHSGIYFRKSPEGEPIRHNGSVIMLNGGHPLEVLDTSNSAWYKVRLTYNGTSYTGYVASQYVYISSSPASSDAEFEKMIADFPESYKPQLRELHKKHPKWIFNPVKTGLDWNTVVANEVNTSREVKHTIEGSRPKSWRSTKVGYDPKKDSYTNYDAYNWFAASDEVVTYYLDPRIYLSERSVFAFETLTYDASQTREGVEAILYGSFMQGNNSPSTDPNFTYAQLIVNAGTETGVSPYHIASRIRQEVGSTNGVVTNGKHSKYPGIYNFYNISGSDSPSGDAPTRALEWASKSGSYGRPWNTVYKSIRGGALYLGENYISVGQNTLYTQKFNVTNKSSLYSHQYMSNVQAVETEAAKVYTAYSNIKMLDNPIVFSIPVYNNMPTEISRVPGTTSSSTMPSFKGSYMISNNYITSVEPSTSVTTFTSKLGCTNGTITITNAAGKTKNSGNIATGDKVKIALSNTNTTFTYTIIIYGDVNGDGIINALDLLRIQKHLMKASSLSGVYLTAANVTKSGQMSALDLLKVQKFLMGAGTINQ